MTPHIGASQFAAQILDQISVVIFQTTLSWNPWVGAVGFHLALVVRVYAVCCGGLVFLRSHGCRFRQLSCVVCSATCVAHMVTQGGAEGACGVHSHAQDVPLESVR